MVVEKQAFLKVTRNDIGGTQGKAPDINVFIYGPGQILFILFREINYLV